MLSENYRKVYKPFLSDLINMEFVKNSAIEVTRVKSTHKDSLGVSYNKVTRKIQQEPLELGSFKKPKNKDVTFFKYVPVEDIDTTPIYVYR